MFGYVTLGSRDFEKAKKFYDGLMAELACKRIADFKGLCAWGTGLDKPFLAVCKPENRQPATPGNGTMIALRLPTREGVDRLHAKALELGAGNEGDPGVRPAGLYCAYFRDPDGNKLNFHTS